jgi:zinc transport system substrate-binding protein
VALAACRPESDSRSSAPDRNRKPAVFVVNYPLKYFTERIGGGLVSVEFPVPPGVDPAFWKPGTEGILSFQKADLIVLNGAGYSKWIEHATLPESKLVDTSSRFQSQLIAIEDAVTHSHGPEGEHTHAGTAFTTWLDLMLAVEHARAVRDALVKLRPHEAKTFEERFTSLEKDLMALDGEFIALARRRPAQPLIASHPVYQYFARRYGLNLKSVHWEPDEMPDETQWKSLEGLLEGHPAKWMLWEGAPLDAVVEKLRALGVGSIVVSPCGNAPEGGDFLSVMRDNLRNLERAYAP